MTTETTRTPGPRSRLTAAILAAVGAGGIVLAVTLSFFFGLGVTILAGVLALCLLPIRLNPLTERKVKRFRAIRRGYLSFIVLAVLTVGSMFAELFVSGRALIVHYEGEWYFPTYSRVHLGGEFGLTGTEANTPVEYRKLDRMFEESDSGNWVLMPLVPFGPYENTAYDGILKPQPPSLDRQHYFGTDSTGRDILARLVYGTRIAILFALAFMILTYLIGVAVGCLMGYVGGFFDLGVQRLIEIWSNIPFLYMVIIIFSIIPTSFAISTRILILLFIMVAFSWTGMTYYMRTATYKEKERDYTAAAVVLGASPFRIIFHHILPNTISTIVTFIPFTVAGAITAVTALDFLGYGLPPPTPSLGELLQQGRGALSTAPWIVTSAFTTLVVLLTLVTFVGEAVREAFDPRTFTVYE